MKKLNFLYFLMIMVNSFSIIKSSNSDEADTLSMNRGNTNDIVLELESILIDPAFEEFQRAHAEFKQAKEKLGKQFKDKKITEEELHRKMEQIKEDFKIIKNSFKAKYSTHKLYSFLEAEDLIGDLRKLQGLEELPLKLKYLLDPKNYNREQFERERITIERKHEAIREFIRTYSQKLTTQEQLLKDKLEELQQNYKNAWYNLKNLLLSFENKDHKKELEFQEAEKQLLQEHNQNYQRILEELRSLSKSKDIVNFVSEVAEESRASAGSGATVDNSSADQQQAKRMQLPKIRNLRSKL